MDVKTIVLPGGGDDFSRGPCLSCDMAWMDATDPSKVVAWMCGGASARTTMQLRRHKHQGEGLPSLNNKSIYRAPRSTANFLTTPPVELKPAATVPLIEKLIPDNSPAMATNPTACVSAARPSNPSGTGSAMANMVAASINVNDPTLITLVNKLQDVFTTVGVSWTLYRMPRAARPAHDTDCAGDRSKTPSTSPRLPS